MKIARPKTEKWHNYDLYHSSKHEKYFSKGFWKRIDRKKFFRRLFKNDSE